MLAVSTGKRTRDRRESLGGNPDSLWLSFARNIAAVNVRRVRILSEQHRERGHDDEQRSQAELKPAEFWGCVSHFPDSTTRKGRDSPVLVNLDLAARKRALQCLHTRFAHSRIAQLQPL